VALFRAKQFDRDDNEWQLSMASTENSALTEGDKAILRRFRDTLLAFMDDCISVLARERFSIETIRCEGIGQRTQSVCKGLF
jgi:hypothetical protein